MSECNKIINPEEIIYKSCMSILVDPDTQKPDPTFFFPRPHEKTSSCTQKCEREESIVLLNLKNRFQRYGHDRAYKFTVNHLTICASYACISPSRNDPFHCHIVVPSKQLIYAETLASLVVGVNY